MLDWVFWEDFSEEVTNDLRLEGRNPPREDQRKKSSRWKESKYSNLGTFKKEGEGQYCWNTEHEKHKVGVTWGQRGRQEPDL